MAAYIFVADAWNSKPANPTDRALLLDDDGYYWHLYRYFEGANLDRREELIDLYGGREIGGYQLDRLEDEMTSARSDAETRPEEWNVLTGWNKTCARENEVWKTVNRSKLIALIDQILWLLAFARQKNLKMIVSGD